jgi:hypothetical protein
MIVCPNCRHQELVGALFCSNCGAQLTFASDEAPTTTIYDSAQAGVVLGTKKPLPPFPPASNDSRVFIHFIDTGDILPLGNREEVTLGRISQGQPVVPEIDLTPYNAYEAGVSRLHAAIHIQPEKVSLVDLGSANGTRVNGKKINPHTPVVVQHGDVLTLGKLKIQMLIRS